MKQDELKKSSELLNHQQQEDHHSELTVELHPFLRLQRMAGNRAVTGLLASHGQLRLQRKCADCSPTSKCPACKEEDEGIQRKSKTASALSFTTAHIQRAPRNGEPEPASEPAATPGGLIVEDDAASVAPGQMRKSEFLEQLRGTVCTTADEALKEAGQTTEGCPYIEQWLSYYEDQEPAHIERALRKYAPEAASATSARDYIPAVSNRVRRAVDTWARTGEVTGVPDELAGVLAGAGGGLGAVAGMLGGALAGIGSAIGGAVSAAAGAIGSAFSSIGKALFKRREGQTKASDDPQSIQAQLSGGQPLDGTVGSRMGSAFGVDFSGVRVHTGSQAAGLSDQLNARAFTIGSDIAFGAGEYQPGTLIGDALIAHELAHVVQQNGSSQAAPMSKGENESSSLEDEADEAAVGAVASLWGDKVAALKNFGHAAMPRLKSGLRLQGCGPEPTPQTPYETLVVEATEKLQDPRFVFGFPWELLGPDCDSSKNQQEQRFDDRYWTTEVAGHNECMLVNKGDASAAIDALFDEKNRDKWRIDCRIFSELPHWYAMLKTMGHKKFDEKFKRIELRRKDLTGLKTKAYWFQPSDMSEYLIEAQVRPDTGQGTVDEQVEGHLQPVAKPGSQPRLAWDLVKEVPVGSRITFGTYPIAEAWPVHKDNTVKMAENLFAAHDVPEGKDGMYTKEEMLEALSEKYHGLPQDRVRILMIEVYDIEKMTK